MTFAASLVPEETAAPATTKAKGDEPAPEILSGEPIVPPPPASTILPEARLITASKLADTPQQQPNAKEAGAGGTSSCTILVTPSEWQHAVLTELIDNPMMTTETLKHFQDTFKDLYKFSTVCPLLDP
jgi:hypothetical protein